MKKNPKIEDAVLWIANNDDPGATAIPIADLAGTLTVLLVADLFRVSPLAVAQAVKDLRAR